MYKSGYLENATRKIDQYLVKYGDSHWKANLHFFLWTVTQMFKINRGMRPKKDGICRIACELKGGVGDMILGLNFLQNFEQFLDCEHELDIYSLHKRNYVDNIRSMCRGQSFVNRIDSISNLRGDYDLYFDLLRFPRMVFYNRKKIAALSPKLTDVCDAWDAFCRDNPLFYRISTPGDYLGTSYSHLFMKQRRLEQPDIGNRIGVKSLFVPTISVSYEETLKKFGLEDRAFLTMQRGIGGGRSGDLNVSTRLWPASRYAALNTLIRERYPDLVLVQLGSERTDPLAGIHLDLRGKTTFDEMLVLLAKSRCHIDAECGMVHFRHFLKAGPSIVFFGPTFEDFIGYEENINLRSDACPGGCEWLYGEYSKKCIRGFSENVCLTQLSEKTVFEKLVGVLKK